MHLGHSTGGITGEGCNLTEVLTVRAIDFLSTHARASLSVSINWVLVAEAEGGAIVAAGAVVVAAGGMGGVVCANAPVVSMATAAIAGTILFMI